MVEIHVTPIRVLELWLHSARGELFEHAMRALVRLLDGILVKARRELATKCLKLEEARHRVDGLERQLDELTREVDSLATMPHVRLVAGVEIREPPPPAVKRKAQKIFRRARAKSARRAGRTPGRPGA